MWTPVSDPEINEAMDEVRKAIDRFLDLGFKYDRGRAVYIDSALMHVRTVITDAIVAAFPRAEDPCRRDHLIAMLDANSPPDHEEALALLDRLAAEDPDPAVRSVAALIRRNFTERAALEADQYRRPHTGEWKQGPSIDPRPTGGCRPADDRRREVEPLALRLEIRLALEPGRDEAGVAERPAR
jgi:hypothetical protein